MKNENSFPFPQPFERSHDWIKKDEPVVYVLVSGDVVEIRSANVIEISDQLVTVQDTDEAKSERILPFDGQNVFRFEEAERLQKAGLVRHWFASFPNVQKVLSLIVRAFQRVTFVRNGKPRIVVLCPNRKKRRKMKETRRQKRANRNWRRDRRHCRYKINLMAA